MNKNNSVLTDLLIELANNIQNSLEKLYTEEGDNMLFAVLQAYNTYQEEERDGVDYIFNINDAEDLKCCIDGGMTAKEIHALYESYNRNGVPYFYFGVNHTKPKVISSISALCRNLITFLPDVLPYVLAYPNVDGYRELYALCMSEHMLLPYISNMDK